MFSLKKILIILFLFIIFGLILILLLLNSKKETKKINKIDEKRLVIPTVDNSVKISLEKIKNGEIKIIVNNPPFKTKAIDYEITYLVKNIDIDEGAENDLISQGAIGSCYPEEKSWLCGSDEKGEKKIILGTCSSGVCRYHNIVGPLKLNLRFTGDYGERVFEKEYQL